MSQQQADRNLLFGILALQMDFITRDALIAGLQAWTFEKGKPLARILVERGSLTEVKRQLLEPLVDAHVVEHGGDPAESLSVLHAAAVSAAELQQVTDLDLKQSLGQLRSARENDLTASYASGRPAADAADTVADRAGKGGTVLSRSAGRFRVLRPHARGGLGEVFVARDEELHRDVALKEIQAQFADHPDSRSRFIMEAEITGGLEHPGIVPVYGLGQYPDGRPFYAMRFIRGDSLKDGIERFHKADGPGRDSGERTLDLRKLLGRFIDVCEAIEYAHSRGVLHRDLKPGNVMLGRYGETLVVDWGLAKSVGRTEPAVATHEATLQPVSGSSVDPTVMGSAVGTPAYMSPEQAWGRLDELGPASDIYSLGATLYCLLTGMPPLTGNDRFEIMRRVQRGDFPRPREIKPQVSVALQAICLKAMSLNPADRYASPMALAEDIEHWLADEPVSARVESTRERLARWLRRHRTGTQAAAAALIVVTAISVVAFGLTKRALDAETVARHDADNERGKAVEMATAKAELAEREKDARGRAEQALRLSRHQLALNNVQRGVALAESSKASTGMAWLLHALETADADDPLRAGILNLMAGWSTSSGLCLPHDAAVSIALFSPNGQTVVTASEDKTARLWDAKTGEPRGAALRHDAAVRAIAFSPDSRSVITGSFDKTARLWDATTGLPRGKPLNHDGPVTAVSFSPDGKTVLTASSDKTTRMWDAESGEPRGMPMKHDGAVRDLAFSPDGKTIVTAGVDRIARMWNSQSGEPHGSPLHHDGQITAVAFSPDAKWVLTGSDDKTARLWDSMTGDPRGEPLSHEDHVVAVAFSPDGQTVITGSTDKTAQLWDASTGQRLGTPLRHLGPVYAVAFSPGGRLALTGGWDSAARLWDAATGEPRGVPLRHEDWVRSVAFSPDGQTILTASLDNTARLWQSAASLPRGTTLRHDDWVHAVAVGPKDESLFTASGDKFVRQWDAITREPRGTPLRHDGRVLAVAVSPDGHMLLTGDDGHNAHLWNLETGEPRGEPLRHAGTVNAVAFSPNGQTLLTGSNDRTARLWDAATGQPRGVTMQHDGAVFAVGFSRDGQTVLTGSFDKTARLWDAATGEPRGAPLVHADRVFAAVFSSDGRTILTGCGDKTARLWDVATREPRGVPLRHDDWVRAVAFSPDGLTLLTGCLDNTARLWDTATGEPRSGPLRHAGQVVSVAFSQDGRTVLTGSSDKTARLWPIAPTLGDQPERIRCWVEVLTGHAWDASSVLHPLSFADWLSRRQRLDQLDGPPISW